MAVRAVAAGGEEDLGGGVLGEEGDGAWEVGPRAAVVLEMGNGGWMAALAAGDA